MRFALVFAALAALGAAGLSACSDDGGPGGGGPGGGGGESAACGNGVIDPGETCDPPGSCQPFCCSPACMGGDACTAWVAEGSEGTCDLRCVPQPITACAADGCCVEACGDDPDCACDALGDCDPCFQCALGGACSDELAACEATPGCVEFTNCAGACMDDACVQACEAMYPDGVAPYQAFFSCGLCDECPGSCPDFVTPGFPGCP